MAELSDKTKAEMAEGARQAAGFSAAHLTPEYIEAVIRTQARLKQLKEWEKLGYVQIVHTRRYTSENDQDNPTYKSIHCAGMTFMDIDAEKHGAFPSEVLIANIALAIKCGAATPEGEVFP